MKQADIDRIVAALQNGKAQPTAPSSNVTDWWKTVAMFLAGAMYSLKQSS